MWQKTFSKFYPGLSKEDIWHAYTDVQNWPLWDKGLESCEIMGDFADGEYFTLKMQNGPKVKIYLYDVKPFDCFSDYCKFFGAEMHDVHVFEDKPGGVQVTNTTSVKGVLSWLWVKLVAKDVAASVPAQTNAMVEYIRHKYE